MRSLQIILVSILLSSFCLAQPTDVTVRASYPTQVVLCGTVSNPATPFSISVTSDGDEIHDTDGTLFSDADSDTSRQDTVTVGPERCITIGHRVYATADDGATVASLALEADKLHSYNWGGTTGTFTTPTIPGNNSTPCPWQRSGTRIMVPTLDLNDQSKVTIDACTGARTVIWDAARHATGDRETVFVATELGTNWSNLSNLLSDADSSAYASYAGTTQDWLYMRGPLSFSNQNNSVPFPDFVGLKLKGYCSGANCSTPANRVLDVQFTFDSINFSPTYQVTLPDSSEGDVEIYGPSGSSGVAGQYWFAGTQTPTILDYTPGEGFIYNSGSSATVKFTVDADCDKVRPDDKLYLAINGNNVYRGVFQVSSKDCSATPHEMTLNGAIDMTPPAGESGWPWRYASGWLNNQKTGFRVRKNSTASSSELRIQYASAYTGATNQYTSSSTGSIEHCNKNLTEHNRYLCLFGGNLYSFDPATGETTFMGTDFMTCATQDPINMQPNMWSTTNPRRIFAATRHRSPSDVPGSDNKPSLSVFDITADDLTEGTAYDVGSPLPSIVAHTCVDLTPSGMSLPDILQDYDPRFNPAVYNVSAQGILYGDKFGIAARSGEQDSHVYLAAYDPGNLLPIGSGGDGHFEAGFYLHEGPCAVATLFCTQSMGFHTWFSCDDAPGFICFQESYMKNDTPGRNAFYVTLLNYCTNPPTCDMWSPGLPDQAAGTQTQIQITTSYPAGGGSTPAGYVTGDPVSECDPGGCVSATDESGDYWHGPLHEGMTLCYGYGGRGVECMHVVHITSPTQITVERGFGAPDSAFATPGKIQPDNSRIPWASGDKLYLEFLDGQATYAAIGWNYIKSPDGTDTTAFIGYFLPGGGHTVVKNLYGSGSPDQVHRYTPDGMAAVTTQFASSTDTGGLAVNILRNATFASRDSFEPGECTDGHLSVSYSRAGRLFDVDIHPIVGAPTCWHSAGDGAAVNVAGSIYKWTGLGLHLKQFPILAMAGDIVLRNISGPSSLMDISSAYFNTVCEALIAGECYAGSSAGDIYVSIPYTRPDQRQCGRNAQQIDDTCVGEFSADAGFVSIYSVPLPADYADVDASDKLAVSTLMTIGRRGKWSDQPNTDNCKALPGGAWALCTAWYPRAVGMLIKLPTAWTNTGTAYKTWVQSALTVRPEDLPAGTASIGVKYGNAVCPDQATDPRNCVSEYPDYFYFSKTKPRAEACVAVEETIADPANPCRYLTEWDPTMESIPCPKLTGCTVNIAREYGAVLNTSIVALDSMGAVISTGPRLIEAATSSSNGGAIIRPFSGKPRITGQPRF